MGTELAVLTPQIGVRSETFIRRHLCDLLPGRTAVVAESVSGEFSGSAGPTLVLNQLLGRGMGGKLLRRTVRQTGWPLEQRSLMRFLQDQNVQVVLGEYLNWALPWLEPVRAMGLRFFAHAHGYDISACLRDPQWRERYREYNRAAGVITMSEFSRARLLELGLEPDRVHVIPYGVDVPETCPERAPQEVVLCIAVGRMVAKKAPMRTLEAFRLAAAEHPMLRLDYLGDGPLMPDVQKYVQDFDLGERVTLWGSRPSEEVLTRIRQADLFVQHSLTDPQTGDTEGLPVSILEAMAAGLPVVSTRHTGIPEAVVDGETGCLVAEGDAAGMAECLAMLAADAERRRAMGQAGWRRARARFAWPQERRALLRLLEPDGSAENDGN